MCPRNAGSNKSRFTLWLSETTLKDLSSIQKVTGKESVAEVVRDAIHVYQELLKARENGVELYYEHSESKERGRIWLLPGPVPISKKNRK